jgi:hypothetical protein
MANALSLTSLHAFISCAFALAWKVTQLMIAFRQYEVPKDLEIISLYICAPILLVLMIGILDQFQLNAKRKIKK